MAFGRRASATASASESTLMENSSNSRASTASSAAVDASSSRECASAPANPSSTASTQSIDATATPRTETQTLAAQPSSSASHSFPQYFPSLIPSPSPSSPLLGIPLDVLRVCQLDAERIDVELLGMLKEQLLRVFSLAPASALLGYDAEVELLLQVLVWYFSVQQGRPPPGCALMNLRLRDERGFQSLIAKEPPGLAVRTGLEGSCLGPWQRLGHLLLIAGLQYAAARSASLAESLSSLLSRLLHPLSAARAGGRGGGGGGWHAAGAPQRGWAPEELAELNELRGTGGAPPGAGAGAGGGRGAEGEGEEGEEGASSGATAPGLRHASGVTEAEGEGGHTVPERSSRQEGNAQSTSGRVGRATEVPTPWALWAQEWGNQPLAQRRLLRALTRVESAVRIASLANLLAFLYHGRYRSLAERVLGVRAVYQEPSMQRSVSFEFMNRQLVWNQLSESLLLLIPLLARFSLRIPRSLTQAFLGGGQERGTPEGEAGKKKKGGKGSARESETRNKSCPICKASPIVSPFRARACAHVFCYYCVRTRAAAAVNTSILQRFPCPLCGVTVDAIKRVQC